MGFCYLVFFHTLILDVSIIYQIFPVSGPVEGGTIVTIVGRELGMRMEDLAGAITVAGVPCIPIEYQVSRRYVKYE